MESKQQLRAAFQVVFALSEAIRELGEVPSGHLYAHICHRISLYDYETAIQHLVKAGLVTKSGHLLRWVGPTLTKEVIK